MEKLAKFTANGIFIAALFFHILAYSRAVPFKWYIWWIIFFVPLWAKIIYELNENGSNLLRDLSWLKDPLVIVFIGIFFYAGVSAMANGAMLQSGSGVRQAGHYYLEYKTKIVEEISYERYWQLVSAENRMASSVPLAFASAAAGSYRMRGFDRSKGEGKNGVSV